MRRALLVLGLVALVLSCASAQTVVKDIGATVAWDPVTMDVDGGILLPEDVVTYAVWLKDLRTNAETQVGETAALEYTVVVPYRSTWAVGVRAVLDGNVSVIAWSTIEGDCAGGATFVIRPRGFPAKPADVMRE